jgi:hypothetical protein
VGTDGCTERRVANVKVVVLSSEKRDSSNISKDSLTRESAQRKTARLFGSCNLLSSMELTPQLTGRFNTIRRYPPRYFRKPHQQLGFLSHQWAFSVDSTRLRV